MELLRKTAAFRVDAQTKDKTPDEVDTISLSGVPVTFALIEPFANLTHLYLVAMKPKLTVLTSLELSRFPSLRLLDVSDNAIKVESAVLDAETPCLPLRRLLMPNNQVSSMDEVRHLASAFPKLEILDLFDNPVMTADTFKTIFDLFPSLAALNAKTREGEEVVVEDSDETDSSEYDDDEEDDDDDDDEDDEESEQGEESDVSSGDAEDADANDGEPAVKKSRAE